MSYDNNQLSKAVAHMLSLSDTLYVIECNEMNVIAYTFEKEGYQKPFANCVAWIKDNYMDMTGGDWCVSLFTTKGLLQYPPEEGSLTLELETPFPFERMEKLQAKFKRAVQSELYQLGYRDYRDLTCEKLQSIGKLSVRKAWRNCGDKTVEEVSRVMSDMGFEF